MSMRQLKIIAESVDMSTVGSVEVTWDFDEESYQEWLVDADVENTQESLNEYIIDYVEFEVEYADNETFHFMEREYLSYDELKEQFGDSFARKIVGDIMKDGISRFETYELYSEEKIDINDPEQLNSMAVRLLQHGEYFKGCRGFILTDGTVIYTNNEHNQVTMIDGINSKFQFIKLGNIRVLDQSIDLSRRPTQEQREVLRHVIASYADETLYLDILPENGAEIGVVYNHPDCRYVMGEIDRYFNEGIKPQGSSNMYESKNINEETKVIGFPDDFSVKLDDGQNVRYSYKDSKACPFLIQDGKLYIGDWGGTHDVLKSANNILNVRDNNVIEGRIWVGAKNNDFNYAVISFWGFSGTENINCKPQVEELIKRLKVNPNKVVIIVSDYNFNGANTRPIPLSQWDGRVAYRTEEENKQKEMHTMSAKDKHDNTKDFRKSRDKKIGEKLTNDKGEEMPMAKYYSMIYQEGKEILVSEDQFNRLFNDSKREILISQEQYDRLFGC